MGERTWNTKIKKKKKTKTKTNNNNKRKEILTSIWNVFCGVFGLLFLPLPFCCVWLACLPLEFFTAISVAVGSLYFKYWLSSLWFCWANALCCLCLCFGSTPLLLPVCFCLLGCNACCCICCICCWLTAIEFLIAVSGESLSSWFFPFLLLIFFFKGLEVENKRIF